MSPKFNLVNNFAFIKWTCLPSTWDIWCSEFREGNNAAKSRLNIHGAHGIDSLNGKKYQKWFWKVFRNGGSSLGDVSSITYFVELIDNLILSQTNKKKSAFMVEVFKNNSSH